MMSKHHVIQTLGAPKPVGPYSQGIVCNGLLFSAGQVGIDPTAGKLVEGGVVAQARQAMRNLGAILSAGGCSFDDVVKTTIYLTTMEHFAAVNEIYATHFQAAPPARSTVAVAGLPLGALVEIDVVAQVR
jgi:2-iminobutanoate/2-iminopropanoate deaminase